MLLFEVHSYENREAAKVLREVRRTGRESVRVLWCRERSGRSKFCGECGVALGGKAQAVISQGPATKLTTPESMSREDAGYL